MQVNLKTITPNAEINIVEIARVSSNRKDKTEKPEGLINYLIKNNHWSPFQHSYLTYEIVTSKAIAIQLLRHLSFTFQEFSQRYSKVEAIEPIELRWQANNNRQSSTEVCNPILKDYEIDFSGGINDGNSFDYSASEAIDKYLEDGLYLYERLLEAGVARECARMILPMATQTTLYMTGSIRSFIHMLSVRDDEHAQKEIQLIAKEIKNIFIKELPLISNALNYEYTNIENPTKNKD